MLIFFTHFKLEGKISLYFTQWNFFPEQEFKGSELQPEIVLSLVAHFVDLLYIFYNRMTPVVIKTWKGIFVSY